MQIFPTDLKIIKPNWSVSNKISAFSTTRHGGVSCPPYDGFNLATHVGDNALHVQQNRQQLTHYLQTLPVTTPSLAHPITWLDQRHTINALQLPYDGDDLPIADACWTTQPGEVCVVMTADCLPILITNQQETLVCAIHAGWKGLVEGVIEQTLNQLPGNPQNLKAWIGPAISQAAFEVGKEVYDAYTEKGFDVITFFKPLPRLKGQRSIKYLANLPGLAAFELKRLGVGQVKDSNLCTYQCTQDFYSYRREGNTGRIGSLIWMPLALA
jgi:YfiH family protein